VKVPNSNFQIPNKMKYERVHEPVLLKEVIEYLNVEKNKNYVDCTIGEGGHAIEILKRNGPKGKVLGIEIDPELYKKLKKEKLERLILVNDSFSNLKEIVKRENFGPISGILLDLGVSSWHIEKSGRGFSFMKDEPLIMRYDWGEAKSILLRSNRLSPQNLTAEEIVNEWSEKKIERILKEYGEEKFAKRISREIVRARRVKPIKTTFQLVEVIKRSVPRFYQRKRIHFATKTFQALRIAVNNELENLKIALPQAIDVLEKGGRLVVISFHSLEDRIVKNFLKEKEREGKIKILTKKPIRPSKEEIIKNPRSRSAKLRGALKIK
jgi:16S rRNA (cytosine1402-N4)-methyltransferase